ncbi:MAG TPA: DUF3572 domain-containing protein [Azospirillaceae bacterium]|nr:DUF3572 domain-containing protein [Azospirillaceae bacterium]
MSLFKKTSSKPPADPEIVALRAVAFIAGDEDMLSRFVAVTGCSQADLQARLADPAFLGGALDFIMADETLAVSFAEAEGLSPEAFQALRMRLP